MRDLMAGIVSQALQTAVDEAVSSVFDRVQRPVSVSSGTKTASAAADRAINLTMCEIQA
jgi:hypothetical protein